MTQRKHTLCSLCGYKVMARSLEVLWQRDCSGPWQCVVGWCCASCTAAYTESIRSLGPVQLVLDLDGVRVPPRW